MRESFRNMMDFNMGIMEMEKRGCHSVNEGTAKDNMDYTGNGEQPRVAWGTFGKANGNQTLGAFWVLLLEVVIVFSYKEPWNTQETQSHVGFVSASSTSRSEDELRV
jgi:hypothetical protein